MGFFATFNTASRREYAPDNTDTGAISDGLTFNVNGTTLYQILGTDPLNSININWGDGNTAILNGEFGTSHQYANSSNKKITITGNIGIQLISGRWGDLISWGTDENVKYLTMKDMFKNLKGFKIEGNIYPPNIAQVTDMSNMFANSSLTTTSPSISSWNPQNVANMSHMFYDASNIANIDLSNWNTSNVTDMSNIFAASSTMSVNPNIGSWNTGNVTNMSNMFAQNLTFNSPIGSWNTGNVTNMSNMFLGTKNFNINIGSWNTGNVTNMDNMFDGSSIFNQNLSNWCVALIPTTPFRFDTNATAWTLPRPIWGTCPP